MKRLVWQVKPTRSNLWLLKGPDTDQEYVRKSDAVERGRVIARDAWEIDGKLAQLVVRKRDGTIQFEHTYGRDPRRTKG